jgi:hypothetical protein
MAVTQGRSTSCASVEKTIQAEYLRRKILHGDASDVFCRQTLHGAHFVQGKQYSGFPDDLERFAFAFTHPFTLRRAQGERTCS